MILYFDSNRSIFGRNAIADHLAEFGFKWMDMTGGQAAFDDGDLKLFGDKIIECARKHEIGIHEIVRMEDPGLGLMFPSKWLEDGISSGRFQRYDIPKDVQTGPNEAPNNEWQT